MFDPQHLREASSKLVHSMFKIGRKTAELEQTKLQTEIQKKQSELRHEHIERRIEMASNESGKSGGKGGAAKNPKRCRQEDEEEDKDLEELMQDPQDKPRWKTVTVYSKLTTGEFITKKKDCKARVDERHEWVAAAAKGKPDEEDDDDDDEDKETKKEKLGLLGTPTPKTIPGVSGAFSLCC